MYEWIHPWVRHALTDVKLTRDKVKVIGRSGRSSREIGVILEFLFSRSIWFSIQSPLCCHVVQWWFALDSFYSSGCTNAYSDSGSSALSFRAARVRSYLAALSDWSEDLSMLEYNLCLTVGRFAPTLCFCGGLCGWFCRPLWLTGRGNLF